MFGRPLLRNNKRRQFDKSLSGHRVSDRAERLESGRHVVVYPVQPWRCVSGTLHALTGQTVGLRSNPVRDTLVFTSLPTRWLAQFSQLTFMQNLEP